MLYQHAVVLILLIIFHHRYYYRFHPGEFQESTDENYPSLKTPVRAEVPLATIVFANIFSVGATDTDARANPKHEGTDRKTDLIDQHRVKSVPTRG